ncbi:MAG: hypothetical protein ABID61_05245 [Candidatus Micrarchaeota archaeon]
MRAQVSSEFMIVYSALFTLFLVLFFVYFDGSLNLFQTQDKIMALRNAQSIASAINFVYLAGDGASYEFTMTNIKNEENITITNYAVTSTRPHASASAPLLNADVNTDSLSQGNITITNNGGEIVIVK